MPASVLIVEDDRRTREGLAELLAQAGYATTAAGTFEEALQVLRATPPDLLIADVRLGPFNGLQLVISSPKPIPAIIITGFADPVLESDARRRGAEYVLKPVDPAHLLHLVEQKLASARETFGIPRRWERKQVIGGLPAQVEDTPARIVDISYGGVRFEVQRPDQSPPESFRIILPSAQLSVTASLVWKRLIANRTWLCGAALLADSPPTEWQGLVDALT